MSIDIKAKAYELALRNAPTMADTASIVESARQIEAYLSEVGLADAGIPDLGRTAEYTKYRDAPAQTVRLDEAEDRDDE